MVALNAKYARLLVRVKSFYMQGSFSLTLNATSLFDRQVEEEEDYYSQQLILPDITQMSMTQSIEVGIAHAITARIAEKVPC